MRATDADSSLSSLDPSAGVKPAQPSNVAAATPITFPLRTDIASPRLPQELLNMIYAECLDDIRLKPAPGATVGSICGIGLGFLFMSKTQSKIFQTMLYKRACICCHKAVDVVHLLRSNARLDKIEHVSLPQSSGEHCADYSVFFPIREMLLKLLLGALPAIKSVQLDLNAPDSTSPILLPRQVPKTLRDKLEDLLALWMNPYGASEDYTTTLAPDICLYEAMGSLYGSTDSIDRCISDHLRDANVSGQVRVRFNIRCSTLAGRKPPVEPELFNDLPHQDDSLTRFNLYSRHEVLSWDVTSLRGQPNITFHGHIGDLSTKLLSHKSLGGLTECTAAFFEPLVLLFHRVFNRSPNEAEYLKLLARSFTPKEVLSIFQQQEWAYWALCMAQSHNRRALTPAQAYRFFRFFYQYKDNPPMAEEWWSEYRKILAKLSDLEDGDRYEAINAFFAREFRMPERPHWM